MRFVRFIAYRRRLERAPLACRLALACIGAVDAGCDRMTVKDPHEVNGQVFYTEHEVPGLGESIAHSVTHDCSGGVRDDDRASALVPSLPACPRRAFVTSYVVDGVHHVDACGERWRVRCTKVSSASGPGPLTCATSCSVEDHFTPLGSDG